LAALQVAAVIGLIGAIALVLSGVVPTYVGFQSFTVLSGSMEPNLKIGALAVVQSTPSDQLKVGDVITYRTPAQPDVVITHRLMSIQPGSDGNFQFETKGDANAVSDLVAVIPTAVLGKVVYSVPFAGYLSDFMKRGQGMMLFIVLPAVLLLLDFGRERLKRRKSAAAPATVSAPASSGFMDPAGGVTEVAPMAAPAPDERVAELLRLGRQAQESGHRELASQAADKVIQLDPRSEEAWILKADCAASDEERAATLRAAAMVNPSATRLAALLQAAAAQRTA
jgi:signal peptidase